MSQIAERGPKPGIPGIALVFVEWVLPRNCRVERPMGAEQSPGYPQLHGQLNLFMTKT